MRKTLKTLACIAVAALAGSGAFANYGWYDTGIDIGGITSDFSTWSQGHGAEDTDLGVLTSLTISGVRMKVWDDSNDRGGANMFFRLYGENGQIGTDKNLHLGEATRITGDHDFSVTYTGTYDLADELGVELEEGKTYYLTMWAKTYGDAGDHYYSGEYSDNFHTKFIYSQHQTVTFDSSPYGTFRGEPTMEMVFEIGGTYHDLPNTTPDGTHARIGWYTMPDGEGGDPVVDGDDVTDAPTRTLYAHWTDEQTLTFDPQNGEDPWTEVFTVGQTYGTLPKPTWAGHAFVGWFTEAGKKLSNTSKVTTRPERTIYAQWSTEQTVVFNAQGGDCDPATMTAEMGGRYGPLPKPTKAGYAFVGWYTQAEGGSHLTANSIVTTLKTRTFYAHWTDGQTVTFDPQGGECDPLTMVATVGQPYGELPKPTKGNDTFRGWYTKAEGGSKVTAAATVTAAKSRKLYAHWRAKGALAISGFSFASRGTAPAKRGAQATVTYTVANKAASVTAGTAPDGSSATYYQSYTGNSGQLTANYYATLTLSGYEGMKITGLTLKMHSNGSKGSGSLSVTCGDDSIASIATSAFSSGWYTSYTTDWVDVVPSVTATTIDGNDVVIRIDATVNSLYIQSYTIAYEEPDPTTPTVSVQASATEIEEGQSVTITASAEGFSDNDSVNWVWYVGATQQAETSDTLVLNDLTAGEYQVTAWGYLGDDLDTATESDDDTVTITVNPASVWYTITVDDQIEHGYIEADLDMAQDGDTVTLTAHPDDGYALEKFYVDGLELPGNTFEIQGSDVTVSATFVVKTRFSATYTVTGRYAVSSDGDVPDGSSATYSQTYGTVSQATSGNSFSLTLSGYDGLKIVGLTLSMRSNGSGGAGNLSVTCGDATIASIETATFSDDSWHGSYTTTYVPVTPSVTDTVVGEDADIVFLINATANSLYCQSYTVEYEFVPVEPSVTLSPSGDLEVYVNDVVTVTATAHDFSGEVEWTWYVDNSPVAGATTATFTLDTSVVDIYEVTAMANYGNDEMAESDPLTVTVKAPSTPHAIEIVTDDNGTVTADPNPAMEGVTVTLTAVPNEGYRLDYVESDEVTIANMQFVMPDNAVGVYAYFEGKHDVVIDDQIVNGSVEASPATAFSDETVTLTVQPDAGYKLDTLTVLDEDLNEIPVTDMSFVMPKSDAYVFATFVELPDLYFQFETSESWTGYGDATIAFVNTGATAEDISSVDFDTSRTLRGTGGTDKKVGSASIRMAPLKDQDAVVVNDAAFEKDIAKVSFQYGIFGSGNGDSIDSVVVQVSADGDTWDDLVDLTDSASTALQTYTSTTVDPGMKYIRFVATNPGTGNDHRFNIDEIQIWFAEGSQYQTVTFDPSPYGTFRGEPTMTMTFEFGGTYHDLPGTTPDGTHARIGWYRVPDGEEGEPVLEGDEVSGDATVTFYAHWTDKQTLTFDPQNGEEPWSEVFTVGSTYGTLPKPTWAGHAFVGWFTEAGKKLSNTSKVTTRPERTIYAQWSTEQTVVFDAQGGDCDPATMTAEMGGRYGPLPKPTKAGYAFVGWYTRAEGGSHLTANSIVTTLKTRTFYAHWTADQTVTFVANGGSCDTTTMVATIGETYGELPKATQAGYTFKGWYTKAEGGSKVTALSTVTAAKSRTLYAHWKAKGASATITGFWVSPRTASPAARAAGSGILECTLKVEMRANFVYEIQWTSSLLGEWTALKHWTAADDGEFPVTVEVPADSSTGFLRIVEFDED